MPRRHLYRFDEIKTLLKNDMRSGLIFAEAVQVYRAETYQTGTQYPGFTEKGRQQIDAIITEMGD